MSIPDPNQILARAKRLPELRELVRVFDEQSAELEAAYDALGDVGELDVHVSTDWKEKFEDACCTDGVTASLAPCTGTRC